MTPTLTVTPNPARKGQKLAFTGSGLGGAVQATEATSMTGTNNDFTGTAVTPGAAGNSITLAMVVSGSSTALSVSVTSSAITVNSATSAGSAATSTAAQVLAALAASAPATALATFALSSGNDGTGTVAAFSATNFTGGVDATGTTTLNIVDPNGSSSLVETMTLNVAGTITSASDFTYEPDMPGVYKFQVYNAGALSCETDVTVWTD